MQTSKSLDTNLSVPNRAPISRWALVILIALCLIFIVSYTGRLVKRAQLGAEADHWAARIEQAKQQRVILETERKHVGSDVYVEEVARNQLGMAKMGDAIVVVIPSTPAPIVALSAPQLERDKVAGQANWQRWFELFVPETSATQ